MPGNSQGIVVSIQAKIEGWQSQLKQIQDALKNLRVGSSVSKELGNELKRFESLINNLGRNVNQRLTSESRITGLMDKLKDVDEFGSIGTVFKSCTQEAMPNATQTSVMYFTKRFIYLTI